MLWGDSNIREKVIGLWASEPTPHSHWVHPGPHVLRGKRWVRKYSISKRFREGLSQWRRWTRALGDLTMWPEAARHPHNLFLFNILHFKCVKFCISFHSLSEFYFNTQRRFSSPLMLLEDVVCLPPGFLNPRDREQNLALKNLNEVISWVTSSVRF